MSKANLKDHREIGRELDLFSFHQYAPGAIFWHPKGWLIYRTLVDYIREKTEEENYMEISTPVMIKNQLFKESGHFEHFGENMFNLKVDKEDYSLKPMNCPESAIVFRSKTRSYNDLPLRLSEFGTLHRRELSGVLGGLLRVRQFTIDDAHIFATSEQIHAEIQKLLKLTAEVYKSLGFKPRFYLATRPDKAMGDKESWKAAEKALEKALKQSKVSFDVKPKDGAFYGPKIDIHIYDSQNRDWQLATIQLDFQIPQSMKLDYVDRDGTKKRPVMVHRGIFGSLERFIGILLEHTQGNLPVWLSPIQTIVLPVSDKFTDFAQKTTQKIRSGGIRAELDKRVETLQAKIRDALLQKIPYILVVGEKEQKSAKVSVRERNHKDLRQMTTDELIGEIKADIEKKV
ncbi:MAG TPA: threonine--tRNA ligase [Patescibacteria group bacterium]|nr:threonine--tRNA ligase [Patescibacteria group bacterium]